MIEVFLHPGEYHVGHADCRIRTLLGSCVSITLWHPARRIGAMSHFLLSGRDRMHEGILDPRFAEEAMSLMLRGLAAERVLPRECQGKLFGGGDMFTDRSGGNGPSLGQRNGELARELMREHGIPVISESLFGVGHRQLIFDVQSGDVWVRQRNLREPPTRP